MSTQPQTKIMVAGGVGLLAVAFVLILVLVLPATRPGSITTEAQPQPARPRRMYPAMEPGMRMMEPGMRPGMMGRGAAPAAEPTAEAVEFQGDPFENSRPNPFVSVLDAQAIRTAGTTYGPDWSQMPLASYLGIGSVQRRPEPEVIAAAEAEEAKFMRIGGIMWTAGRPLAMYEMRTGETGSVAPGDIVDDWQIEQIGQDYVAVRNVVSGESRRLGLRGK